MAFLAGLSLQIRQYLLVTANYWVFTLTDGALRMLVVLHFCDLGYSPLQIALLFLFYEVFGVVTNLVGGWLGAYLGLNRTMNIGLALQVVALLMLMVPAESLTIIWVMAAQAFSGVAKDLNKMSAKSAIKLLVPNDAQIQLFRWVAILTGSKNTLKGVGFFLGGALLSVVGFQGAVLILAVILSLVFLFSVVKLKNNFGRTAVKPKFSKILSKSSAISCLSAARLFLFAARDIWFVVALPVYLAEVMEWDYWMVGGFLALWVMAYGIVQGFAPALTGKKQGHVPDGQQAMGWAVGLAFIPAAIALSLTVDFYPLISLFVGLMVFGTVFAVNSSLHSYLIVSYASEKGVSLDVGFYYMANAAGRLLGTVLSGWVFQNYGLAACLWVSAVFVVIAAMISIRLPKHPMISVH